MPPTRSRSRRRSRAASLEAPAPAKAAAPAAPTPSPAGPVVAVALLFAAWLAALNFRPITGNDFWIHLRIGQDVLRTGAVPRVDDYSAVARGLPFIAHEWLGGVVSALVERALGPAGATLLRELASFGVVALLLGALTPRARRAPVVVPLLALCAYLVCWRIEGRPDLFTMLMVAAFSFAAERWRRERRPRDLAWIVPLEALWVNLHGAFLFGVVLAWGIAGCAALAAYLPAIQRADRRYSWRDVRVAAAVAAGCTLATLLNPYGVDLLAHTVRMSQGGEFEFIRRTMSEWQPPFSTTAYFRSNFQYLFLGFAALLAALGAALLARRRDRPLTDLFLAGVATWLAVGANRFIPYAAIIGFPIVVRASEATGLSGRRWAASPYRRLAEGALLAALLAATLKYGFVYGPERRGELGWGYAGRRPLVEAEYIRAHGLQGALYNEVMTDGSYLVHSLYPAVRPVMDARIDFVGEARYQEYEATRSSPAALTAYLRRYDVRLAIVARDGWMGPHLRRSAGWTLAVESDARQLFTRR